MVFGRSGRLAGPVGPEEVVIDLALFIPSLDLAVRQKPVFSFQSPGEIVDDLKSDVFRSPDPAEHSPLVLPRPFESQGVRFGRRPDQDGRVISLLEGKAQVGRHSGIRAVRGMRADLRDDMGKILSLRRWA